MDFAESRESSATDYEGSGNGSDQLYHIKPDPAGYHVDEIEKQPRKSDAEQRIDTIISFERYLEFFNSDDEDVANEKPFNGSQLGSVTWEAWEKSAFFDALSTKGRHNIVAITETIGTKSEVEVRSYLIALRQAFVDRQRYALHAKTVSYADVPAAIEVDEDLENELDQAAERLASAQDEYDLSVIKSNHEGPWRIDTGFADRLEEHIHDHDSENESDDSLSSEPTHSGVKPNEMFKFKTLLELSRRLFMNTSSTSHILNWTLCADADNPEPAITVDAIETLYTLIHSLIQRILQTALFLAESRLRSTTTHEYIPARVLKDSDVHAALSILGMPEDSFEFWRGFPRRSGLRVVEGVHDKTKSRSSTLKYEAVETALSIRASRGRRRSLSSMLSTSSAEDDRTTPTLSVSREDEDESQGAETDGETEIDVDPDDAEGTLHGDGVGVHSAESDDVSSSVSESRAEGGLISRKRRQLLAEDAEDAYLERLDKMRSVEESQRLREILGLPAAEYDGSEQLFQRPRKSRKTEADLSDWATRPYRSPWEVSTIRRIDPRPDKD